MIFSRVHLPSSLKEDAPPGNMFATSKKKLDRSRYIFELVGLLYLPSERPMLFDHASHLSIEVIEKARENELVFSVYRHIVLIFCGL